MPRFRFSVILLPQMLGSPRCDHDPRPAPTSQGERTGRSAGEQVNFDRAVLHVTRAKKGTPGTHPIVGGEMRALRGSRREQEPSLPFVFTSERGSPFACAKRHRYSMTFPSSRLCVCISVPEPTSLQALT
jgi:hypothetical protein